VCQKDKHGSIDVIETSSEKSAGKFEGSWESLGQYQCPDWFRDAKLGIFLHWGPSSVAAVDDWYGRSMYIEGSPAYVYHKKTFGHPSTFGFKDLIPLWTAENFDADALVRKFKQAGAGYVVPVATFHDNYDLWDSKYQRWNSLNIGPKKDICGMWKNAALENGLRFGVSTHMDRVPSWFNTSRGSDASGPFAGIPYDGSDPKNADLYGPENDEGMDWAYLPKNASESWRKTWYQRTKDLIDSYRPDLLYFDGGIPYKDVGLDLLAHYYNENMRWHDGRLEAVMNLKKTKVSGAYREGMCVQDLERSKLEGIKPEPWQTDTSIGPWFCRRDGKYESPNSIINMLVDIVSKNGNLLLNIPLAADGALDAESEGLLSEIGKWMTVNGEAIFKTRPWTTFGEGPTAVIQEYSEEIKESFTAKDFRFTTRDSALYAICMEWPANATNINIESLSEKHMAGSISRVRMLGYDGPVIWERNSLGLNISLPNDKPLPYAFAFKIDFEK
jgi:alpha-L-fucosidase